jgi:uncharacterized protein YdaU (DUF1376 family)
MNKKLKQKPPMPLFCDKFDQDTAGFSPAEVGVYLRLLMHQWNNKTLPHEMSRLAGIARCSQHLFNKAWKTVGTKFVVKFFIKNENKNEFDSYKKHGKFLVNETVEEVRKNREDYIKNQTLLGYKGAEAKHQKKIEALRVAFSKPSSEPLRVEEATNTNTIKEDILVKVADAPFELPTKEEITEASPIKTNSDMDNVCTQLYEENIFPDVHAFKNKMLKVGKNEKAILHTLCRCYLSRPEEPWGFCKAIMDVEDGNYNERDHTRTAG